MVERGSVKVLDYKMLDVDDKVPAEPGVATAVADLRDGMTGRWGDLFQTKLGTARPALERTWDPKSSRRDTPLGNFLADTFRNVTKTDIALTPLGLVAERIAEGPVTGLDVFRAVSYGYDPESGLGFRLAKCTIRGADLVALLELGVSQVEYTDALFPQTSGLTFSYLSSRAPGSRVLPQTVFVDGSPLEAERVYSLTVNEGVAYLAGLFGIPLADVDVLPASFEYTVVRDEIQRQGVVRSLSWGRIQDLSAGFEHVADYAGSGDGASR
jgi:2',3'-cyclic-nucleotide 2'-phosphodiesterase (5'-nucleotidase family)